MNTLLWWRDGPGADGPGAIVGAWHVLVLVLVLDLVSVSVPVPVVVLVLVLFLTESNQAFKSLAPKSPSFL